MRLSDVDRVDDLQLRRVMAVASGMAMEMRMCEELEEKGQRLYIHRANRSIARLRSGYSTRLSSLRTTTATRLWFGMLSECPWLKGGAIIAYYNM